jgi:hypothetical protein
VVRDKEKARVLGGKVNENVTVFFESRERKENSFLLTSYTVHIHSAENSTMSKV